MAKNKKLKKGNGDNLQNEKIKEPLKEEEQAVEAEEKKADESSAEVKKTTLSNENGEEKAPRRKEIVYEPEKIAGNSSRKVLQIILAVIAIGAAVATLLLSPMGKRILGKGDKISNDQITQGIVIPSTTGDKKPQTTAKTTEATTEASSKLDSTEAEENKESEKTTASSNLSESFTAPKPTEPILNPYKNYSVFIDKANFDYTELKGVTTIVSKKNDKVSMVIKPLRAIGYKELCDDYRNDEYKELPSDKKAITGELTSAFKNTSNGYATIIYCVDDKDGGSIEIKCRYPQKDTNAQKQMDVMLSMFKVHEPTQE